MTVDDCRTPRHSSTNRPLVTVRPFSIPTGIYLWTGVFRFMRTFSVLDVTGPTPDVPSTVTTPTDHPRSSHDSKERREDLVHVRVRTGQGSGYFVTGLSCTVGGESILTMFLITIPGFTRNPLRHTLIH